MTTPFEELFAKAEGHAEAAASWLETSGNAAVANSPATQAYLMIANVHATLAEAYARMASAQIVNQSSMAQVAIDLSRVPPSGQPS